MKDAHSISTRRAYGVQRVCRVWRRARSSVYARRQATTSRAPCRRRGPVGAAPDDVLAGHIRRLLEASPFHGEGYRKAWAKLRVAGIRTSPERVRRLMREHDLQAPHRVGHAHGPKAHDGTITTAAPDVMWGTDMTATVTVGEGAACVFVAVDHCTTECIGLHAATRGTRFEALEPIRQGVRARFGTIGEGVARGLRLRHDHGSNYLADDFQQEVAFFGLESSPSFVREPEGNGVAERFIRTLKENLLWVRSFDTIEELRLALLEFKRTYNEQWMLKRFSDSPCTAWARRGTSACTNAGGPMQAYSMDLRERALLDSDAGMKAADVAVKYRVSGSWVRLLKQRRRETGEVAPRVQRHGRRRMLEPHLHTLAALIAEQPDRTLAELKDALGTPASLATIWRAVAALDVTVKKNGPALRTRST